jgi:hypothetical protein
MPRSVMRNFDSLEAIRCRAKLQLCGANSVSQRSLLAQQRLLRENFIVAILIKYVEE